MVTSKTAPAVVVVGDDVVFTITVTNTGPDPATDVVVTDSLPLDLGSPTASDGRTIAAGVVTWDLGTLASGETRELTVTGTASVVGTLANQVSSASSTPDPDHTDINGTSAAATTTTEVQPAPPPPNRPPVADDRTVTGSSGRPLVARATAADPDDGQVLTFTAAGRSPQHGRRLVLPSGLVVHRPDSGFAGHDSFELRVCDNGDPRLCDSATTSVENFPVAVDDTAETFAGTSVLVPVAANDVPGGLVAAVAAQPENGAAALAGEGLIRYAPDDGFVGTDTFRYSSCSPDAPPLCVTATVTVQVLPRNHPPVATPLVVDTVTTTWAPATRHRD